MILSCIHVIVLFINTNSFNTSLNYLNENDTNINFEEKLYQYLIHFQTGVLVLGFIYL